MDCMATTLKEMLDAEREQLEAEALELQGRIKQAQKRLSVVQWWLEHVRALLDENQSPQSEASSLTQAEHGNDIQRQVCDIADEILTERGGEPMYYKELAQEVIRRGGSLYGATPWANLTARMVQDSRFVRPTAKGFYALRSDYPNARNVGARRQRRRRTG